MTVPAPAPPLTALSTAAARNLASTLKSRPQMQGMGPRWLLKQLPWVEVQGGVFRVNQRRVHYGGPGRVSFTSVGNAVEVAPRSLAQLPRFRDFDDEDTLGEVARSFETRELSAGESLFEDGSPADTLWLIASGKIARVERGPFDATALREPLGEGDYLDFGGADRWGYGAKASCNTVVLGIGRARLESFFEQNPLLAAHRQRMQEILSREQDRHGQAEIHAEAGHTGEPVLRSTFADYQLGPREYELSVAQTILRIHTRVTDLYNHPMDQREEQLRLTIESLKARTERQLLCDPEFGLLTNVHAKQRIHARGGPPSPDDMDELISRRRGTRLIFAHPRTIAAIGKACNRRGIYPQTVEVDGQVQQAWRGIPMLPCDEFPITDDGCSSVVALRPGLKKQGVVGLRQTGIPDEHEPGLNIRFMGIDDSAVASYLVSNYFSVAAMIPDAYGVLEQVQIHH